MCDKVRDKCLKSQEDINYNELVDCCKILNVSTKGTKEELCKAMLLKLDDIKREGDTSRFTHVREIYRKGRATRICKAYDRILSLEVIIKISLYLRFTRDKYDFREAMISHWASVNSINFSPHIIPYLGTIKSSVDPLIDYAEIDRSLEIANDEQRKLITIRRDLERRTVMYKQDKIGNLDELNRDVISYKEIKAKSDKNIIQLKNSSKLILKNDYIFIMPYLDVSPSNWFGLNKCKLNSKMLVICIFQLVYMVFTLQSLCITHGDLYNRNIFWHKFLDDTCDHIKYRIEDTNERTLYLDDVDRMFVMVGDFGESIPCQDDYVGDIDDILKLIDCKECKNLNDIDSRDLIEVKSLISVKKLESTRKALLSPIFKRYMEEKTTTQKYIPYVTKQFSCIDTVGTEYGNECCPTLANIKQNYSYTCYKRLKE